MKMFSVWLPILVFLFLAPVTKAVSINGQSYTPLADWARANSLYGSIYVKHGDEIILTNRTARLVFTVDSAESRINGVNIRLSYPVAAAKNVPFISQLDIDHTIRPLLYLSKPSPKRVMTICLDPGHGGKDSGNRVGRGFFGHSEKTYTLALALELRDDLRHAGFNVILTRTRDVYVDLPTRPALANHAGADLFISLHFNATEAGKDGVSGPETYCITPVGAASSNANGERGEFSSSVGASPTTANRSEGKSLLLAYLVQKSLVRTLDANDRSVRRARFAVLRDATMPAILIEGGYMTHPLEGPKIFDPAYRKQMAAAIVRAVLNYQKLTTVQR